MRVIKIIDGTTVDGPGFRTSIYFAGCHHHCPGCHNPQSWDPAGGEEMSVDEILGRVVENEMNVTYSGGDPLYQIDDLAFLSKKIKELGREIWCYTGFRYEELINVSWFKKIEDYIDVLVEGPFMEELRDTSLLFRGSSNQRIIDLTKTKENGKITEWQSSF